MRGDLWKIGIGAVAALLLWWGIAFGLDKWRSHKATQAQAGAAVAGQAQAQHTGAAQVYEARLAELQTTLEASRAEVARAKAALAKAKASTGDKLSPIQTVVADSATTPKPVQETPKSEHDAKDVLLKAQEIHISNLEEALKVATLRGDSYKAALDDAVRRGNLQEAALKAALAARDASKLRGRIEGFAVGLGTGYIGGRLGNR